MEAHTVTVDAGMTYGWLCPSIAGSAAPRHTARAAKTETSQPPHLLWKLSRLTVKPSDFPGRRTAKGFQAPLLPQLLVCGAEIAHVLELLRCSGSFIREDFHPKEEIYEVIEGELVVTHRRRYPDRPNRYGGGGTEQRSPLS